MIHASPFYLDLAYIFVAALIGGLVARRLGQPLIVGYVLAGILVGPFTPGPQLSSGHTLQVLAEVGVILLMYSIGIEFSPRELLKVKWVALVGGPLGIALTILLSIGTGYFMGWSVLRGVAIGSIICVASTMVMSRLLIDRGELTSEHGRVMVGITLIEDLAVVMLTVILPVLALSQGAGIGAFALEIGKGLLILVPVIALAMSVVPKFMSRISNMRNAELYVLVVLSLGFATAAITQALGLSLALGAFLGGMIISETGVAHETLKRLQPLRDAFVALFFVTVGALIDPKTLFSSPLLLSVLIGLIVIGKFVLWTILVRLFRYPLRTAVLVGIGLTQIGEFSFVLVQVAQQTKLVGDDIYNAVLAASLLTILLNASLMRVVPRWLDRWLPTH